MKKVAVAIVSAMIVLMSLAACSSGEHEDLDIDSGVVYSSHGKYVKVDEDDGERDTHRVSRKIVSRCSVGERWPDCKRK